MNTIPRAKSIDRHIMQWAYFNTRPHHREFLLHAIRLHGEIRDTALCAS